MRSARSPEFGMPANGMVVPGTSPCGVSIYASRDFSSQVILAFFIAVLRRTLPPWTLQIEPFAFAEAASQLTIDINREPAIQSARRQAIGRAHDVDHGLDETCLIWTERLVAGFGPWQVASTADRLSSAGAAIGEDSCAGKAGNN